MIYEFEAELHRLEGKIKWTVFYFPHSSQETFGTNSRVNVKVVIDGHSFLATLLPSHNGHYVPFNQAMKEATRKKLGDRVHVTLSEDSAPRTVEIPDWMRAALAKNDRANAAFSAQPAYAKRDAINHILHAKTDSTREKRLEQLIERLSN